MTTSPSIRIHAHSPEAGGVDRTFADSFRIGRGAECEVSIPSPLASRTHAEVFKAEGSWWIRDLESTNGLYINGEKVQQKQLADGDLIQTGAQGPAVRVDLAGVGPTHAASAVPPALDAADLDRRTVAAVPPTSWPPTPPITPPSPPSPPPPPAAPPPPMSQPPAAVPAEARSKADVSDVIGHYFDEDSDRPAGEHTKLIRSAYKTVRTKETRKWRLVVGGVVGLLLVAVAFGGFQRVQNQRLQEQSAVIFGSMKELDVTIFNLRRVVEQQGGEELTEQLERLDAQRERLSAQYEGYVRDMGVYRRLNSREERLIYQTARAFGESETTMSSEFVDRVRQEIDGYWRTTGRARFQRGVERAQGNDYVPFIVETLTGYGLPPEFFYLGLQESDFIPDRIGPDTRWGRAKGAWQFIPTTARRYGLNPGLRAETDEPDPLDERQNFFLATDAAARYLLDLHGTLTQASGLLVMASYNWGEHRVLPRLNDLPSPDAVFAATFEDVPADPEWRNYWRFLSTYGDRMPDETKDYVLKIFAAAVIGSDPRYFGFDFDNPLLPYID